MNGSYAERDAHYREVLEGLTIMSDTFMRNVLKDVACTEHILRVILDDSDLTVLEQALQMDFKNLHGRSATLDCVACDGRGWQFNVEIQQENEGASPKRARYHGGLLDMNTLEPGDDFSDLPETYVIFITRRDVLGYGLPIYHIRRKIDELGEEFRDEAFIIYVNSSIRGDTELGRLMHDLHCRRANDMHSMVLARRVRELKETKEGIRYMCEEMDKIYRIGQEDGIAIGEERGIMIGEKRGEKRGLINLILKKLQKGKTLVTIADEVEESVETVTRLIQEMAAGN